MKSTRRKFFNANVLINNGTGWIFVNFLHYTKKSFSLKIIALFDFFSFDLKFCLLQHNYIDAH